MKFYMDQWAWKFSHLSVTAMLSFGAIFIALTQVAVNPGKSNLPQLLFLCGTAGTVAANYRRLALLSEHRDKLKDELANSMVTVQLYLSPVVGGVFAMVFWAACFSGLLAGDFFPHIDGTDATYDNFHDLMANTHPSTFKDAMKGVFWCFLAGYSERFVPSILGKLEEKAGN